MSAADEELYSLLVPLADERLIVPRACVAEVVRYTPPVQKETEHPWMLGSISWNGRDLPVVAFEGAIGKEVPAPTGRTRNTPGEWVKPRLDKMLCSDSFLFFRVF